MNRSWPVLRGSKLTSSRTPKPRRRGRIRPENVVPLEGRALPATLLINPANELFLTGGAGINNNLTISLSGETYTFNDTAEPILVTNNGTATVDDSDPNNITVSGIVSISADLVDGDDIVNLQSTAVPTLIDTNLGANDVTNLGSTAPALGGDLLGIQGLVTLEDGDAGVVNVDDSADTEGRSVLIGELSSHTGIVIPSIPNILVGTNIHTLNFYGGTGPDTFDVGGLLGATDVNINAGDGDDILRFIILPQVDLRTFDGGAGSNEIDYADVPVLGPEGVTVDLSAGTASFTTGISNIQHIVGSTGNDTLTGSDGPDIFDGGDGDDEIHGLGGEDEIHTGSGINTVVGGPDADFIEAGDGDDLIIWNNGDGSDIIDGGDGDDIVRVNGSDGDEGDQFLLRALPGDPAALEFSRTNLGLFALQITSVAQIQVNGLNGADVLTVDFANGNPIPAGIGEQPGVVYDGNGEDGDSDSLVLAKSDASSSEVVASETYTATAAGAGDITFDDRKLSFLNLAPITDTVPATDFTFVSSVTPFDIQLADGPDAGPLHTARISSVTDPAAFELIDFANKTNVTINAAGQGFSLNNPTAATGLATLAIVGGSDLTNVDVRATPSAIPIALTLPAGAQFATVSGPGVGAGSTLTIDGGAGDDNLLYDAAHTVPTITPGPGAGQITISVPGAGSVVAQSFERVVISNAVSPVTTLVLPLPTLNAVEDQPLIDAVVAQFDAGTVGDASQYDVSIDWNDTTPPTAGSVARGAAEDAPFSAAGTHTYYLPGSYVTQITIRDRGGSTQRNINGILVTIVRDPAETLTAAAATVVVADAPLVAQGATVRASTGVALTSALVASFYDTGGVQNLADYTATIDWGDGTATSAGVLTAIGTSPAGTTVLVNGAHNYIAPGTYPITVTINSAGGSATLAHGSAVVATPLHPAGPVAGRLAPSSDTGVSQTDGITKDNTPTFIGTAGPGSIVTLLVVPSSGGTITPYGTAVTDAAGNWTINVPLFPDGTYNVSASAVGEDGSTASSPLGTVIIDTVAPVVTAAQFQRGVGLVTLGFRDGLSGLDGRALVDGSNYIVTKANSSPGSFLVTKLTATPPTGLQSSVAVQINQGRALRGGAYTLVVRSGGLQDIAGNALDGEFYGTFPSGNGLPGGDFVARLNAFHNTVLPPAPANSTASPLVSTTGLPNGTTARRLRAARLS